MKHRTDNGRLPDTLSNPADRAKVVKFLESIDVETVPFVSITASRNGAYVILAFDSVAGVEYVIEGRVLITGPATQLLSVLGNGQRMEVALPIDNVARFYRLVAP